MKGREQGGFDPCLANNYRKTETRPQQSGGPIRKIGEVDLQMGIQFVVNPPAKLPEGFKFGPVFV